jgi:putative transposase
MDTQSCKSLQRDAPTAQVIMCVWRADRSISANSARQYLQGNLQYLRSDNGLKFIAKAIQDWTKEQRIGSIYFTPGSPWEQAHVESFHDKPRDECLNRELYSEADRSHQKT